MPLLQTRLQCFTNHYLPDAGVGKKGKEQSSKAGNCSQMKTRSENKESLEICCEYINWKKSFIESILQKKKKSLLYHTQITNCNCYTTPCFNLTEFLGLEY